MTRREEICKSAAEKLRTAAGTGVVGRTPALVGLDGFVDEIIAVVDKRHDQECFEAVHTIAQLAGKIGNAAGQSSNYELIVKQMKLGGNGPIMANALASLGLPVTYIGNLGFPSLHPVFEAFAKRATVISIAEPAHTDALEFQDGKLMLGKLTPLAEISWQNLLERVGMAKLTELVDQSRLIGMVNWTMLPHMSHIWQQMLNQIMPRLGPGKRRLFIDLADPEKRNADDIRAALALLGQFGRHLEVTLGLNLKEAFEIVQVLQLPHRGDSDAAILDMAGSVRKSLDLACVVVHPRHGAAAAKAEGGEFFAGPFVANPKISTGAGDHFNAGFALGEVLGFTVGESLCMGVACSGYYVRYAASPTAAQLAEFMTELPAPQQ